MYTNTISCPSAILRCLPRGISPHLDTGTNVLGIVIIVISGFQLSDWVSLCVKLCSKTYFYPDFLFIIQAKLTPLVIAGDCSNVATTFVDRIPFVFRVMSTSLPRLLAPQRT